MSFETLDHTADIGFTVEAVSSRTSTPRPPWLSPPP